MTQLSVPAGLSYCYGYCRDCHTHHRLPEGGARARALEVMDAFRESRRLDYFVPAADADPRLAFDRLFPGDRGHMFGVLECRDAAGESVVLRAFSSLHEGIRTVPGWSPPLLAQRIWDTVITPEQEEIKQLSRSLGALPSGSPEAETVSASRRERSRKLVAKVQGLYRFRSFRGEERSLREAFAFGGRIPGGVGECCAPKLLTEALVRGLTPVGMVEFYWGGPSKSGDREPGSFYGCCAARCQPILGFMLCGLPA